MKKLSLSGRHGIGKHTLVDDDIYELVKHRRWFWHSAGYVWGYDYQVSGWRDAKGELLHRFILQVPKGFTVDHIDRNGLNNQRSNLRIATYSQQNLNQKRRKDNTSGHRGVYWESRRNCWRVCINVAGKQEHVGQFKDKGLAIAAYQARAAEVYGDFYIDS